MEEKTHADKWIVERVEVPILTNVERVIENMWSAGGNRGWYFGTKLWKFRGFVDKLIGGVGYRQGRSNAEDLKEGDQVDFWRVLKVDKTLPRILFKAEMKTPGDVYMEWKVKKEYGVLIFVQKIYFKPNGFLGKAYWYGVEPLHQYVLRNMARQLVAFDAIDN